MRSSVSLLRPGNYMETIPKPEGKGGEQVSEGDATHYGNAADVYGYQY